MYAMNKERIVVPKGIEFLSQWSEFSLPNEPCILNKQITGCGFTQWALTCPANVILCSPRRILLENKEQWFKELEPQNKKYLDLYYARNDYDQVVDIDQDLSKKKPAKSPEQKQKIADEQAERRKKELEFLATYEQHLRNFLARCSTPGQEKYCKILVTYDSFRKVRDVLLKEGIFQNFYVIVDEMQSLWTDAAFKAESELEFVTFLQDTNRICYVSATPMMESYLDMLDEFKSLRYFEMDWESQDPSRLVRPKINMHPTTKIITAAKEIVEKYRNDSWDITDGNSRFYTDPTTRELREYKSREAVFYINSVKNICDIIRGCKLTQDECNVICAKNPENEEKIRKAFGVKKTDFQGIGKVPSKKDINKNKMFTFCTRTVYLGADFYSTNARSFIFSDANSRCLIVDIALDLPQILGRQRCELNPWKTTAEFYYFPTREDKSLSEFDFRNKINEKIKNTNDLIDVYNSLPIDKRKSYIASLELSTEADRYNQFYLSLNCHAGTSKVPVFNNYVYIAELRAHQIAQGDYVKDCYVRSTISNQFYGDGYQLDVLRATYEKIKVFEHKMKFIHDELEKGNTNIEFVIEDYILNYIKVLGIDRIKSLSYRKVNLDNEIAIRQSNQKIDIDSHIYNEFQEGSKISCVDAKKALESLYDRLGYQRSPKATDLEDWFDTRKVKIKDSSGKWIHGLELIKKKGKG